MNLKIWWFVVAVLFIVNYLPFILAVPVGIVLGLWGGYHFEE